MQSNPTKTRGYEVLCASDVQIRELRIHHSSRTRDAWTAEFEQLRLACIEKQKAQGKPLKIDQRTGKLPKLYRLDHWRFESKDFLDIWTSETDYAEYLVSNTDKWREFAMEARSDPIGISVVVKTQDNKSLVGRRSGRVHDRPNSMHVIPAGHVHPPESFEKGLLQELYEELDVSTVASNMIRVTGLLRSLTNGKPELTFRIELTEHTALQLIESQANACDSWEFEEVWSVDWTSETLSRYLIEQQEFLVPPGHAALLLAGRIDFGHQWYNNMISDLNSF